MKIRKFAMNRNSTWTDWSQNVGLWAWWLIFEKKAVNVPIQVMCDPGAAERSCQR